MQSLTPLRLRPVLQRICCLNEAHRSSQASTSKFNRSLITVSIPDKPKRPGNPFLQFIKDVEMKIYTDKPDSSRQEIMKTASAMWREADESIKNRYNDVFKQKNKEYAEQMEEYNKNLTQEQKAAITFLEERAEEKKKTTMYRKALKELGKPPRPCSAYGLFLKEHPQKATLEGETNKDRLARLSNEWKEMSETKKDEFLDRAKELLDSYNQDMRQWEKIMLKKFNVDEDEIEALTESFQDGKITSNSKKLSSHILSLLKKKDK